jgi:hypothetical protein
MYVCQSVKEQMDQGDKTSVENGTEVREERFLSSI